MQARGTKFVGLTCSGEGQESRLAPTWLPAQGDELQERIQEIPDVGWAVNDEVRRCSGTKGDGHAQSAPAFVPIVGAEGDNHDGPRRCTATAPRSA